MLKLSCKSTLESIQNGLFQSIGDKDKTDLVIICAENVKLRAHKLVLASTSIFFKSLLKDQPLVEATTTIHFPDVSAEHFKLLFEFIYKGEVKLQSADHINGLKELLEMLHCNVVETNNNVVEPAKETLAIEKVEATEKRPASPEIEEVQPPAKAPAVPENSGKLSKKARNRINRRNRLAAQTTENKTVAITEPHQPNNTYRSELRSYQNRNHNRQMNQMYNGRYRCPHCFGSNMSIYQLVYHWVIVHANAAMCLQPGRPLGINCICCMAVIYDRNLYVDHLLFQHMHFLRANFY